MTKFELILTARQHVSAVRLVMSYVQVWHVKSRHSVTSRTAYSNSTVTATEAWLGMD